MAKIMTQLTEDEEIIKEMCTSNGITYSRLRQEGLSCLSLELFFSGYPRMIGFQSFPNLQILCIVGQSISKIENLHLLGKLRELWIVECKLKSMEGLENIRLLKRLFLYSNMITKIANLDHMVDLQTLHLNGNQISVCEGLSNLKQLKELNLAENKIEKIGNSLNSLQHLEILELSGNKLSSLNDLTNLARLPFLRSLGLKSPIYSLSPVAVLCNYAIHVIYHLPQLTKLDNNDISGKAIKDLAEATVAKKKIFYTMKRKTVEQRLTDLLNKLSDAKDRLTKPYIEDRIFVLQMQSKEIDREIQELKISEEGVEMHESGTESDMDAREAKASEHRDVIIALQMKRKAIRERIKHCTKKINELEQYCTEAMDRARRHTDCIIHHLECELETVGNIRFEYGKPSSDSWFSACHDLILSRFCSRDYKDLMVTGIQINRILRVNNRILRSRFENALLSCAEEEESYVPSTKQNSYKKLVEYLFWVWDPELPGGLEAARVLEEGFMSASTYQQLGRDAAVLLTNSVYIADRLRIQHAKNNRSKDNSDYCPFRTGQIVISKAYVGKCAQSADNVLKIEASLYPESDSVFRLRKDAQLVSDTSSDEDDLCECAGRQCEWFIFNHEMVLPEYVVEFEYVYELKPKSPFHDLVENLMTDPSKVSESFLPAKEDPADDSDVLDMFPETRTRSKLTNLTEDVVMRCSNTLSIANITRLNLHNNALTRLKPVQSLTHLRKLIISFNLMTKLDELANMGIEYLDASFNKLVTLDGMKNMTNMKHLDISWNQLHNTRDAVSLMRKHLPVITFLDLRHNPWQKPEGIRLRAIGRMKTLTKLNGMPVTEAESTAALRLAAGSRISHVSLISHSRMDGALIRSLYLGSNAQVQEKFSRMKPDRVTEQDDDWYHRVTSLCLDDQHISKLSSLERLENLRWASFNNNDITKIEGLDSCLKLEELSLEYNCIRRLDGISHLVKLRRLSVGHNFISSIEPSILDRLAQLQFISIEDNRVSTLSSLANINSLTELYAGNNLIENMREVFFLKGMLNLTILDLSGNPISSAVDNYRLFVIYHLKSLKAFDGSPIEYSEGTQAKEIFGGRMTQDFLVERLGHSNFMEVKELDFPQSSIQTVDLGDGHLFANLKSVNLEHNNLSSFSGLIYLTKLKLLCLNHNHVECIFSKMKSQSKQKNQSSSAYPAGSIFTNPESYTPVLENLEVLHLGYNGIKDLTSLQLNRLPSLKALFLQGNEISRIEGLEQLKQLLELVLDRNKIKQVDDFSFLNQTKLQELHLEENRLRSLSNLSCLQNLERLYLGMNRIQDMNEVDKLEGLTKLVDVSLVSNAVAKRNLHRPILVYHMSSLQVIDGISITDEERAKAQLYFVDQQTSSMTTPVETMLPGINGQYKSCIPVKVTNVQLMSPHVVDKSWGATTTFNEDLYSQDLIRGIGGRKARVNGRNDGGLSFIQPIKPNAVLGALHSQAGTIRNNATNEYIDTLNRITKVNRR